MRDYVTLTKPRIMTLLLLTGACGAVSVARSPAPGRLAPRAARARARLRRRGALNHVLDRDIDRLMGPRTARARRRRTADRAARARVRARALGLLVHPARVDGNLLTAVLALVGNLFYVVVYTGYLKRRGPRNIVLGGVAGAVPPLVGYAAATGNVALPALWLFAIVFLWTPPHFWSLALLLREHYEPPTCRCCRSSRRARHRPADRRLHRRARRHDRRPGGDGNVRACSTSYRVLLGGVFLGWRWPTAPPTDEAPAALFHYSLLYLALLFVAAALDPLL